MNFVKFLGAFFVIHLFCFEAVKASHIRAGEVIARRISNLTFEYEFTFIGYRDTETNIEFGGGDFDFGDGTVISGDFNVIETQLTNNIVRAEFTLIHTYKAPNSYIVSYSEDNRNAGIANMENSLNTPFYTETLIIIDPFFGVNNTPILTVPPIDEGIPGARFIHNAGAFDIDGDSLAYYLVIPKMGKNSEVVLYRSLNHPDFYTNFGQGSENLTPPSLDLNEAYGDLIWDAPGDVYNLGSSDCPSGVSECAEYNVAFRIEEWRKIGGKWYRLGYVTRDMQIIIYEGDNEKPKLEIPGPICVTAGDQVVQAIVGTDPDGHQVKIEAFGGPFEVNSSATYKSPNSFPATFQDTPGKLNFEWNTFCGHIRERAYEVQFKVADNPIENNIKVGPTLTEFGTWEISIVGPAPQGLALVPKSGRSIELTWDDYVCSNASEIEIWRRVGDFDFDLDDCEVGMPPYSGYSLIAKTSASETLFVDQRLAPGANYCYRIVAQFPNPGLGTSYISEEVCLTLETDAPVITHVDVLETSEDGRIKIDWTPPYATTFPAPYTYSLYRSSGFYLNEEILVAEKISDTLFIDQMDLNTADYAYAYRIAVYDANNRFIDSSAVASSVKLGAKPLLSAVELSWQANVPWSNNILSYPYHYVYRDRSNLSNPDLMTLIDSVKISEKGFSYLDYGRFNNIALDDELIYCYALTTYGGYDNPILPTPLVNNSQIVCAQPNDNIVPCSPLDVKVSNSYDCDSRDDMANCSEMAFENIVSWLENESSQCDDDVIYFRVYFSPTGLDQDFYLLDSTVETSYQHSVLNSFKGCYRITAVDRSLNESDFSNTSCIDNCSQFILPNAFSPNGDAFNDTFRPMYCPRFILKVSFKVLDRTGKEVFDLKFENESSILIQWDGKNNVGSPLAAGVYFYVSEVTFDVLTNAKQKKTYKGWIQLLK
tara:strand:+ start:2722 stop:5529 length:2808 start_codon:yes stop_codon:yes gene_type:complete